MSSKNRRRHQLVKWYDVSDPKKHEKGHTVYKVTSRVFPVEKPDQITETVVWRRYNDFKKLHEGLFKVHKSLQKRDDFPVFAKAKLFGRFEDAVVEERRLSALDLLKFTAKHVHLSTAAVFLKFFEGGEKKECIDIHVPTLQPIAVQSKAVNVNGSVDTEQTSSYGERDNSCPDSSTLPESLPDQCDDKLGGVWHYRQKADNISFNSDDETEFTDDSNLNTPLPDTDMSFFDPLKDVPESNNESQSDLHHSSSWLFSAMSECAELDLTIDDVTKHKGDDLNQPDNVDGATEEIRFMIGELDGANTNENYSSGTEAVPAIVEVVEVVDEVDMLGFDPLNSKESVNVALDGDCTRPTSLPPHVIPPNSIQPPKSPFKQGLSNLVSSIASRTRSRTAESVTGMDLGGNQDYIYQAANLISLAQECEASGNYEVAFGYYKTGVGILLKGVQGDKHKSRRDAVRRKTAQYLLKAEDIYNHHIATRQEDDKRWGLDSKISPISESEPTIMSYLQGPVSELRNYTVIGIVDNVQLVMDKTTQQSFILKVLQKNDTKISSTKKNIIPTQCPHMVQFYKFYETQWAVFILLEHASGGKLWTYISGYLQQYNKDSDIEAVLNDSHERKLREGTMSCRSSGTIKDNISNGDKGDSSLSDNDLKADPDICSSYVELLDTYNTECETGSGEGPAIKDTPTKTTVRRFDSFGFEESAHKESTGHPKELNSADHKMHEPFFDVLAQNRPGLDQFTIESIDGDDYVETISRHESSLSEVFDTIPECNESTGNKEKETAENKDLINNARELIQSVEKLLVDSDAEVEFIIGTNIRDDESASRRKSSTPINNSIQENCVNGIDGHTNVSDEVGNVFLDDAETHLETISIIENTEPQIESDSNITTHNITNNIPTLDLKASTNKPNEDSQCNGDILNDSKALKEELKLDLTRPAATTQAQTDCTSPTSSDADRQSMTEARQIVRGTSTERSLETPNSARKRGRTMSVSGIFRELDLAAGERKNCHLPELCVRQWAAEMLLAISHLHSSGIILRDLRPDNILLGERGHIMLTYFSQWSCVVPLLHKDACNGYYTAPELKTVGEVSSACDWWSFGALLYELLTGHALHASHPGGITPHSELSIPDHVSSEARDLLEGLLCHNPNERTGSGVNGVEEIKLHPFFNGVNWKTMLRQTKEHKDI